MLILRNPRAFLSWRDERRAIATSKDEGECSSRTRRMRRRNDDRTEWASPRNRGCVRRAETPLTRWATLPARSINDYSRGGNYRARGRRRHRYELRAGASSYLRSELRVIGDEASVELNFLAACSRLSSSFSLGDSGVPLARSLFSPHVSLFPSVQYAW